MPHSCKKRVYVVSAGDDGRWRIDAAQAIPWSFPTQSEAEDFAIALALRAIPSVILIQCPDGTVQREICYE